MQPRDSSLIQPAPHQRMLIPEQWRVPIPETPPGATVDISVTFTAPSVPCSCISYWKMFDGEGTLLFPDMEGLYCLVQVVSI